MTPTFPVDQFADKAGLLFVELSIEKTFPPADAPPIYTMVDVKLFPQLTAWTEDPKASLV